MKNKICETIFPGISKLIDLKSCLTEREGELSEVKLHGFPNDLFILNGGS
jgi:hypothetical protein